MNILLTAFTGLFLSLALFAAYIAARAADEARNEGIKLRLLRGQVAELVNSFDAQDIALKKLRGQVSRLKQQLDEDDFEDAPTVPIHALPMCENYRLAQREGPRSAAAACECPFCSSMRSRRRAQRAALIPSTAAGQAEMAEENAKG